MLTRIPALEWKILPSSNIGTGTSINGGNLGPSANSMALVNGVIWCTGKPTTIGSGGGFKTIAGYSASTGAFIKEINIEALTGAFIERGDWAVDHNGYLWGSTQQGGFYAGYPYYIIIDTANSTLVSTIGVSTLSGIYAGVQIKADKPNKLMWVLKNGTTLDAISSSTYAVSHSITLANNTGHQFVVDEDKDELWVYNRNTTTLVVYKSSTGALLRTVATLSGTYYLQIIPSQGVVVAVGYNSTFIRVYSTTTYTEIINAAYPSSDTFYGFYYSSKADAIYGYYYDDTFPSNEYIIFFDRTTLLEIDRIDVIAEGIAFDNYGQYFGSVVDSEGSIFLATAGKDATNAQTDVLNKIAFVAVAGSGSGGGGSAGTPTSEINYPNSYNRELILDLTLGAWYVYDMNHADMPRIHDYVPIPAYTLTTTTTNVTDSVGALVTDSLGNNVTTEVPTTVVRNTDPRKENFKFLVTNGNKVSLAEYRDYSFTDWVSYDGVGADFSSYLITGYNLAGDMARKKQVIYLQIFCKRTETVYTLDGADVVLARQSSCYVQSQWDWCEDVTQGKWGTPFQAYRFLLPQPASPSAGDSFAYGPVVITTKNKLRGRGDALSLYIYSEAGKDMKLLGWNTLVYVNGEP